MTIIESYRYIRHLIRSIKKSIPKGRKLENDHFAKKIHPWSDLDSFLYPTIGDSIFNLSEILDIEYTSKKPILLISHDFSRTGAPAALFDIAKRLKHQGKAPLIISPFHGPLQKDIEDEGIPTCVMADIMKNDFILQTGEYWEYIIANTVLTAPIIRHVTGTNIKTLWWIHEADEVYRSLPDDFLPYSLSNNINVFAVGPYATEQLQRRRPNYNINQLLYTTDDLKQLITLKKGTLEAKLPKEKLIFANIGTIQSRKGQDVLVEAIEKLPKNVLTKCVFLFIGNKDDKEIVKKIESIKSKYDENVIFSETIPRNELYSLYNRIDCLVCSSRDDPMPIVVSSALSLGIPVICSNRTGSAGLLRKYNISTIYDSTSPDELQKLITNTYEKLVAGESYIANERKIFEDHFSEKAFDISFKTALNSLKEI